VWISAGVLTVLIFALSILSPESRRDEESTMSRRNRLCDLCGKPVARFRGVGHGAMVYDLSTRTPRADDGSRLLYHRACVDDLLAKVEEGTRIAMGEEE
jgi:hypothetical protein